MTREIRENKKAHAIHQYEKVEREINGMKYYYYQCRICGQVEYPIPELQKLWEYAETHQFMFIQDWILALMYAYPEIPIVGITSFLKQLFLTLMEFAQEHNIPTENPGFKGYKFGPYSERIEDVIIGLEDAGIIKTEGRFGSESEYFELTEKGKRIAEKSFNKLTPKQRREFRKQRMDWHQLGTNGLMKYIYKNYPDYTNESLILDRVLHRRRKGRLKWVKE